MRLLFFLFIGISTGISAQEISLEDEEIRKMEFAGVFKSSISIEGGGKSGFAGLSYDLLLSRRWRVGVGAGFPAIGADVKFYPTGVKRFKPIFNIGLRSTAFFSPNTTGIWMHSLPIGLSYFGNGRINLEVDAGPMIKYPLFPVEFYEGLSAELNYVWFSVKVGYRFSFYAIKRARDLNRLKM